MLSRPYQSFTWHDAGQVDHFQMGRLRDQRVRRQRDDVVAYPRQGLTLERASEVKGAWRKTCKGEGVTDWEKKKLLRLVLVHEGHFDLAGGGETEIISSDCSTSPLQRCGTKSVSCHSLSNGHAHKTPSQTEQQITDTAANTPPKCTDDIL